MSAAIDCRALGELLHRARAELACELCGNGQGVWIRGELGECPSCHGEHRNSATIELLEQLAIRVDQLERIVCP